MDTRSPRTCCYLFVRYIPVIFILALIGWSYYAYVVAMCILIIDNIPKKVIYICVYHILFILFLWSYARTVFRRLFTPSNDFYISDIEGERLASAQTADERRANLLRLARQANLPLLTRNFDGSIRYCPVCQCIKPDRAHHCSICGKCVLRYDHHCPWTNSCVSYGNYKFFLLFLTYALLFCIFIAATSLEYFIQFWKDVTNAQQNGNNSTTTSTSNEKFQILFLFFLAIIFAISVSSLFFFHLYLTGKNRTTVESSRAPFFSNGPQKEAFNLGCQRNYQEIFGTNFCTAFLPIATTRGDGIHYQVNNSLFGDLQQPTAIQNDVRLSMEYDRNHLLTGENHTNSRR